MQVTTKVAASATVAPAPPTVSPDTRTGHAFMTAAAGAAVGAAAKEVGKDVTNAILQAGQPNFLNYYRIYAHLYLVSLVFN